MTIDMSIQNFEDSFKNKKSKQYLVYMVLKDGTWHCRECEYIHVHTTQLAGSGGIQGLKRGGSGRAGIEIESDNHLCSHCNKTTRHDRWTKRFLTPYLATSMPKSFIERAFSLLGNRDVVDNIERAQNHLTIDHKLPMIRWNDEQKIKQVSYEGMTDNDIRSNFQILKKSNGSISHNSLKSRSCEECWKTNRRGKLFGINYFYEGNEKWKPSDKKDRAGCVGCGWFDVEKWRRSLNEILKDVSGKSIR